MLEKFRAAVLGVGYCLKTQINMTLHFAAMFLVIGLGLYFRVQPWEWAALVIVITLVLTAEIINTAIEVTVNLCTQKYHPLARIAKDVAAGAVFVTAAGAVVVGYLIFGPRLGF